jgi:hypothetical protein
MRDTDIPNKTAAGYAEIQNRSLHLGPRQRTLLISIDGAHSIQQVREQFRVLGDVSPLIEELCTAGLLVLNAKPAIPVSSGIAVEAHASPVPSSATSMHEIPPLGLVRQFMNETSVQALGLRAFMFTLKLERCTSRVELEDVLPEYQRLLGKARKSEPGYAEAMARRVEEMLAAIQAR